MKFNFMHDQAQQFAESVAKAKPSDAAGTYLFKWDYLLKNLMSKYPQTKVPAKLRKKRAIQKIIASNLACGIINEEGYKDESFSFRSVIARASFIARDLLGPYSHSVLEGCIFTNGATTSRKRSHGDAYYKYHRGQPPLDVTKGAFPLAYALIAATPRWAAEGGLHNINIVEGNLITTVPKNSEIDRTIAKEPDLNACLQKGIGLAFERRLRRVGINLRDQTTNQALAWLGSKDDSLATIDLSSASDSISVRLVRDIIPDDWLTVLEAIRCPTNYEKSLRWEIFSSMGNGFTFGLETIIFFCIAQAVMEEAGLVPDVGTNLAVYGDDIICPSSCADRLIWVLSAVGFTANEEKTFTRGPFRESCGKHYYNGDDVTPFFIRSPIDTVERACWFLNRLRLWAYDENHRTCDPSVFRLWLSIRRRWVPDVLLGGRDINDISCVYSPELPRKRIKVSLRSVKLRNWRGLLRWFQFNSGTKDIIWASVSTEELICDVSQYEGINGGQYLTKVNFSKKREECGRLVPDSVDYIDVVAPWAPCRIKFPQEICDTLR